MTGGNVLALLLGVALCLVYTYIIYAIGYKRGISKATSALGFLLGLNAVTKPQVTAVPANGTGSPTVYPSGTIN